MIIGFDIDNVIADMDKTFLEEFLKEDKNKRNKGIINPEAEYITDGMFDWTKQEVDDFLKSNMSRMAVHFELVKDAKKYMDKLKRDGHKIYIITGRNTRLFDNPEELTIHWLNKQNINYDKLIFTKDSKDKSYECFMNNIDIMFDDRPMVCFNLLKNKIKSYLFKTQYNYKYNDLNIPIVENWEEIYKLIRDIKK